jgi:hypothetical protein
LGLLAAGVLSVPVPVQATDWAGPTLRDAARAFDDAALRVDTAPATELARWTGPINLAVPEQAGMLEYAAEVETAVRTLAAIAGVAVHRVAPHDPRANFVVRASSVPVAGKSPCRSSVDWSADGHMLRAELVINLANPGRITRCINHETMHGFGFRAHAHEAFSVLSYRHANQATLTATDRLMLETLYDRRLKPGMRLAEAAPVACRILAEKLRAPTDETTSMCSGRGSTPPPRQLVSLGRSRAAADVPPTAAATVPLHPGYREDGH